MRLPRVAHFALAAAIAVGAAPRAYPQPTNLSRSAYPLPVRELVGRELTDPAALNLPGKLRLIAGRLVVLDPGADRQVVVVDQNSGRVMKTFGRKGAGPGEFQTVWSVEGSRDHSGWAWVYDPSLRRLTLIDVMGEETNPSVVTRQMISLSSGINFTSLIWSGRAELVALGFFRENRRIAVTDTAGNPKRFLGELPPHSLEAPAPVRQHAYQATLTISPDASRIAVATRHADYLDIYTSDGHRLASAQRFFRFEPVFTVEERGGELVMGSAGAMRFGFIDIVATNDRIFALFSGRTRNEAPGRASYGQFVHVYDWEGRLSAVYRLGSEALSIAVSTDGRRLFAVQHDPLPAVVAYALPAEPQPRP